MNMHMSASIHLDAGSAKAETLIVKDGAWIEIQRHDSTVSANFSMLLRGATKEKVDAVVMALNDALGHKLDS